MVSPFAQVAEGLLQEGLAVIPLRPNSKIPAIKDWSKYSKELPTEEDVAKWMKIDNANVGVVMGEASNLIGLDFDYDVDDTHDIIKGYLRGPEVIIKKGKKGCTMFFTYSGEKTQQWNKGGSTVLDLLSNGTHTVMPPSIHPEGDECHYLEKDANYDPPLPRRFIRKVNRLFTKGEVKKKGITGGELKVDLKEVEIALSYIDNTDNRVDYDTWLRIGMALKEGLGDDGYEVWTNWSSNSSKSTGKSWETKWRSFKGDSITLGTLFHKAMENGFEFSSDNVGMEGIVRPSDLTEELEDWRKNGIDAGESTGFDNLDKLIHFKKGELTIWTGYANNGKSEVLDSVALKLMDKGWKFLYCSLEKLPRSHVQSLVHKVTGLPIQERSKEVQRDALEHLNSLCSMIGRKDFNPTIDNIVKMATIYKNLYGLDALVIDPFNYISSPFKGDIFNHSAYILEKCTFMAQTLDISVHMVAHPRKPDKVFGNRLPRLTSYAISGSADFANMADMIIAVYRTVDDTNRLEVLKVRDQDIDRTGTCEFAFDQKTKAHIPYDDFDDL